MSFEGLKFIPRKKPTSRPTQSEGAGHRLDSSTPARVEVGSGSTANPQDLLPPTEQNLVFRLGDDGERSQGSAARTIPYKEIVKSKGDTNKPPRDPKKRPPPSKEDDPKKKARASKEEKGKNKARAEKEVQEVLSRVLRHVPHRKEVEEAGSAGSFEDRPIAYSIWMDELLRMTTPTFLKNEFFDRPAEQLASAAKRHIFEAAHLVNLLEMQALTFTRDPPTAVMEQWNVEKEKILKEANDKALEVEMEKIRLNKEKQKFEEEKENHRRRIQELEGECSKKDTKIVELERTVSSQKRSIDDFPQRLQDQKKEMLKKFLSSSGFDILAQHFTLPAMSNGLFMFTQALQQFYPFTPEEIGLKLLPQGGLLDWSSVSWNEETGQAIDGDGQVIGKPTGVFPDLMKLKVKHPWSIDWPADVEQIVAADDDEGDQAPEE